MKNENNRLQEREDHLGRNYLQRFLRKKSVGQVLPKMETLISKAKDFGLPQIDVENAEISLDYNEFGVSFDTVVEQLYQYDIKIDKEFYHIAMEICDALNIDKEKYQFLNDLIVN